LNDGPSVGAAGAAGAGAGWDAAGRSLESWAEATLGPIGPATAETSSRQASFRRRAIAIIVGFLRKPSDRGFRLKSGDDSAENVGFRPDLVNGNPEVAPADSARGRPDSNPPRFSGHAGPPPGVAAVLAADLEFAAVPGAEFMMAAASPVGVVPEAGRAEGRSPPILQGPLGFEDAEEEVGSFPSEPRPGFLAGLAEDPAERREGDDLAAGAAGVAGIDDGQDPGSGVHR